MTTVIRKTNGGGTSTIKFTVDGIAPLPADSTWVKEVTPRGSMKVNVEFPNGYTGDQTELLEELTTRLQDGGYKLLTPAPENGGLHLAQGAKKMKFHATEQFSARHAKANYITGMYRHADQMGQHRISLPNGNAYEDCGGGMCRIYVDLPKDKSHSVAEIEIERILQGIGAGHAAGNGRA